MEQIDPLSNGYVIVTGHGRSGSNMLLDILNEHPRTLCRNEPDAMANSPLRDLPDGFFERAPDPDFAAALRARLGAALGRTNERDHFALRGKTWFRSEIRALIGQRALRSARIRRALAWLSPELATGEWPTPEFYLDRQALGAVLPVLKILLIPGWIVQTHAEDPGQKILHILRAPESFLGSWFNRYVQVHTAGAEEVHAVNSRTLPAILEHFGATSDSGAAFSMENLIETELWRWRYMNELLLERIGGSERYKLLGFREVGARDRETIADIYGFCGLDLDDATWSRIGGLQNRLFRKTTAQPFAGIDLAPIVERVLDTSPLGPYLAKE